MMLGLAVLGEVTHVKGYIVVGIILSLSSAILMPFVKGNGKEENLGFKQKYALFGWIAVYSVIWGCTSFSMRYFALKGMSLGSFISGWYSGAFVVSAILFLLAGKKEAGEPLKSSQRIRVVVLGATIWASLCLSYWTREVAPIAITQPVLLVSQMIFPALVGLYLFKENKQLSMPQKGLFLTGALGGLIILFSFTT